MPALVIAACAAPGNASPTQTANASVFPAATLPGWASTGVTAVIDLGKPAISITADESGVWVRIGYGDVAHIDPTSNAVVAVIAPGFSEYGNVRVGAEGVWSTDFYHDLVHRIDAQTNEIVAEIEVGQNPEGITVTDDTVWVANHRGGSISRIDPSTNAVVATLTVGPAGPSGPKGIVLAGGDLWTAVPNIFAVLRVNPDTGAIVQSFSFTDPGDVLTDGVSVYVYGSYALSKIDVATNTVTTLEIPAHPPTAFADGSAWAVNGTELWRLDPVSFEPQTSWQIAESETFGQLAFAGGIVWVATDDGHVIRVDPGA
jgi:YVTN family beta-propeller protein